MKSIGLTGGIGMGKSACAELLRAREIPVVDTDILARRVVEPGQPALIEIQSAFGPAMLGPDGQLRRGELARLVFSNATARRQLEAILHPRIRRLWHTQLQTWQAEGRPVVFVVIPLLFETNAEKELDMTICVACSLSTQRQRLLTRGWSSQQIQQRLDAQWSVEKKIALSTFVIWTEGGLDIHAAQLDRILRSLAPA